MATLAVDVHPTQLRAIEKAARDAEHERNEPKPEVEAGLRRPLGEPNGGPPVGVLLARHPPKLQHAEQAERSKPEKARPPSAIAGALEVPSGGEGEGRVGGSELRRVNRAA